jgi:membrane-bound serine protease (ClpP class)
MTDVLIIVAGIGLLILEMVVIPGFGVAGIGGIVLILWGLYE